MVKKAEPLTKVLLNTPDGSVTGWANVKNEQIIDVEIENVPVRLNLSSFGKDRKRSLPFSHHPYHPKHWWMFLRRNTGPLSVLFVINI